MTTAMSESVLQSNSGAEVSKGTVSHDAEISSGEPGSVAVKDGVSVALVQNVQNPMAEKQTAEHVRLDDDDRKCCTLL